MPKLIEVAMYALPKVRDHVISSLKGCRIVEASVEVASKPTLRVTVDDASIGKLLEAPAWKEATWFLDSIVHAVADPRTDEEEEFPVGWEAHALVEGVLATVILYDEQALTKYEAAADKAEQVQTELDDADPEDHPQASKFKELARKEALAVVKKVPENMLEPRLNDLLRDARYARRDDIEPSLYRAVYVPIFEETVRELVSERTTTMMQSLAKELQAWRKAQGDPKLNAALAKVFLRERGHPAKDGLARELVTLAGLRQ